MAATGKPVRQISSLSEVHLDPLALQQLELCKINPKVIWMPVYIHMWYLHTVRVTHHFLLLVPASKPFMLNFGYLLNARVLDRTRHHMRHWGDIMRHDDRPGCARIQDISNTQFRWTMVIAKGKLFLEVSICHCHACVRFLERSSNIQLLFSVFVSLRSSQSKKQVLRMCLFRTDDCRPPVDQRSKWDTPLSHCYVNLMSLWLWSRQNKISCMKKLYICIKKQNSNLQWAPRKTYTQVYTTRLSKDWKFQSFASLPA